MERRAAAARGLDAPTTTAVAGPAEDPDYAGGWWANLTSAGTLIDPEFPRTPTWASGHDGQRIVVVPSERLVVVRLGFSPAREDNRVPRLVADLLPRR